MSVFNRRKQKQRNARRRTLMLGGAGIGVAGLIGGGLLLQNRKSNRASPTILQPTSTKTVSAPATSPKPRKPDRQIALGRSAGGTLVHLPGKGRHHPDYYVLPPGRSHEALIERIAKLGKPGGRKRSRKNWTEWDFYRDSNKGAYNLRNTKRFDSGRFRMAPTPLLLGFSSRPMLSSFSPHYWD